jgi:hypothetical protein
MWGDRRAGKAERWRAAGGARARKRLERWQNPGEQADDPVRTHEKVKQHAHAAHLLLCVRGAGTCAQVEPIGNASDSLCTRRTRESDHVRPRSSTCHHRGRANAPLPSTHLASDSVACRNHGTPREVTPERQTSRHASGRTADEQALTRHASRRQAPPVVQSATKGAASRARAPAPNLPAPRSNANQLCVSLQQPKRRFCSLRLI